MCHFAVVGLISPFPCLPSVGNSSKLLEAAPSSWAWGPPHLSMENCPSSLSTCSSVSSHRIFSTFKGLKWLGQAFQDNPPHLQVNGVMRHNLITGLKHIKFAVLGILQGVHTRDRILGNILESCLPQRLLSLSAWHISLAWILTLKTFSFFPQKELRKTKIVTKLVYMK